MDEQHDKSQKSGLFLGVLVGVAATLFVTTKRGRRMLGALREEGLGKFSDWEKLLEDVADAIEDEEFVEGDDYIVKEERPVSPPVQQPQMVPPQVVSQQPEPSYTTPQPSSQPMHHTVHHHVSEPASTHPTAPQHYTPIPAPQQTVPAQPEPYQPVIPQHHHYVSETPVQAPPSAQPAHPHVSSVPQVESSYAAPRPVTRPRETSRRFFRRSR